MRPELARVLSLSSKIPAKVQEEIYNTGDSHAIYYLAKRADLPLCIQEKIVKSNLYTSQWSISPRRPKKLISQALKMPQSDTTYMQLSQQELLTPSQAMSLLGRKIPMVGYSLSKRSDLPKSIKLKAIKLYSQILDLNSNHQNKQEIVTLIGKNTHDWVLLTKELEIDNLFLLTLAIESTDGDIKLHENFMNTLESVNNTIVNKKSTLHNSDATNPRFVQVNNFYHYEDLTPAQSEYLREVPEEKRKPLVQEFVQMYRKLAKSPNFSINNLEKIRCYPFFDKLIPEIDYLIEENFQKSYNFIKKSKCGKSIDKQPKHLKSLKHLLSTDVSIAMNYLLVMEETLMHRQELSSKEIARGLVKGNGPLIRELGILLAKEERYEEIHYYIENSNSLILDDIEEVDEILKFMAEKCSRATLEERTYMRNPKIVILNFGKVFELTQVPYLLGLIVEIIESLPAPQRAFCYSMLIEWEGSLETLLSASANI
jgi:hypothetical protein